MELKAPAHGTGFQLISLIAQMSSDSSLSALLNLSCGAWDLVGCTVGFTSDELSRSVRSLIEGVKVRRTEAHPDAGGFIGNSDPQCSDIGG